MNEIEFDENPDHSDNEMVVNFELDKIYFQ